MTEKGSVQCPDLDTVGYQIRSYGCKEIRPSLVCAVSRPPEKVRRFIYDRCVFVSIPSNLYDEVWPADVLDVPANADDWLISLRSPLPEEHAEAVVAHEIAPGWLGTDRMDPKTGLELEEAVELVGE